MTGILEVYKRLHEAIGYRNWWPIVIEGRSVYASSYRSCNRSKEDAFEIAVGAILTQNTTWSNVVRAIWNLKKKTGVLNPQPLSILSAEELGGMIRPAGYFNQKSRKLKIFSAFVLGKCKGNLLNLRQKELETTQNSLLSLWGIGPETADSILLYALGFPTFIVDTYTRRIFSRLGFIEKSLSYSEVQEVFLTELPKDVELYGEYHALLVELGKNFCHPKPLCHSCPIKKICLFNIDS